MAASLVKERTGGDRSEWKTYSKAAAVGLLGLTVGYVGKKCGVGVATADAAFVAYRSLNAHSYSVVEEAVQDSLEVAQDSCIDSWNIWHRRAKNWDQQTVGNCPDNAVEGL